LGGLMGNIGQRGDGLAHKGAFTLPRPPGATFAYARQGAWRAGMTGLLLPRRFGPA
jgi:hypothetical protein